MMTIQGVMNRFSPDFAAARELVREQYGREWLKVVKAYRAKMGASLETAISDLAEGANL